MFSWRRNNPNYSGDLKRLLQSAAILARGYSHDYIGVEHVFLCLRDLPESDEASKVLGCLPFDIPAFWADLEKQAKIVTGRPVPKTLPYTPRLKKVLELAKLWAAFGKAIEVTPLHFLGGVSQERNSLVAHIFRGYFKKQNPKFTNQRAMASHIVTLMQFPYASRFQIEAVPNQLLQATPSSVTPPTDAPATHEASQGAGEEPPPAGPLK